MSQECESKQVLYSWNFCKCRKHFAVRAPPPKDVYWQNLGNNTVKLQIIFSLLGILFVVLVGVCLFYLHKWQTQTNQTDYVTIGLISLFIFVADTGSQFLLKIFTILQKHHSLTQAQLHYAYKLVIFNTIVTIFLPNLIYSNPQNYFQRGNLGQQILFSIMLFSFLGPLSFFFKISYWFRYIQYLCLLRRLKSKKATRSLTTVKEGKKLAELSQFQFSKRYAESLIPLLISSYYFLILPIGPLIASLGAMYNHVIVVFQWMIFYRRPGHLSARIARHFVNMLILVPILMCIGMLSGASILPGFNSKLHIPIFVIFIIFTCLSFYLVRVCLKRRISQGKSLGCCAKWAKWFFHMTQIVPVDDRQSPDRQEEVQFNFDQRDYWEDWNDYTFQDPIYHQKAVIEMLKKKREKEQDLRKKEKFQKQIRQTWDTGFFNCAIQQINRTLYDRQNDFL